MEKEPMDSGHVNGFYLAEGEAPEGSLAVIVGVGDDEGNLDDDGDESAPIRIRRFFCARRVGAKVADTRDGQILLEIAV